MKSIKIARKPFSNPCQLLAKASSRLNSTAFLVFALLIVTPLIVFVVRVTGQSGSALLISEFRVRGPNGANDEFIEIYNNSNSAHVVASKTAPHAGAPPCKQIN